MEYPSRFRSSLTIPDHQVDDSSAFWTDLSTAGMLLKELDEDYYGEPGVQTLARMTGAAQMTLRHPVVREAFDAWVWDKAIA